MFADILLLSYKSRFECGKNSYTQKETEQMQSAFEELFFNV